jgi:hypothetical protein
VVKKRSKRRKDYKSKDLSLWQPLVDFLNKVPLDEGDLPPLNTGYGFNLHTQEMIPVFPAPDMQNPDIMAQAVQAEVSLDFPDVAAASRFQDQIRKILSDVIDGRLEKLAAGISNATPLMRYFPPTVGLKLAEKNYVIFQHPLLTLENFRAYVFHALSLTMSQNQLWRFGRCESKECLRFFLRKTNRKKLFCSTKCRLYYHNYEKPV